MLLRDKRLLNLALVLFVLALFVFDLDAQCPMCRISAESNLENGGTEARGLNKGILYMLSIPYVIISTLGYIWWKNNKKQKSLED